MAPGTWLPALREVEVNVTGLFPTHHCFETKAGAWGKLTLSAFGDHGTLCTASGRKLEMRKRPHGIHWLWSAHELVESDTVRGWASRCGLLQCECVIHCDGQEYTLEPDGLSSPGWYRTDMAGNRPLEIQPRGIWRQAFCLTLRGTMDADLIALTYYLVYTRSQEDAAAAS